MPKSNYEHTRSTGVQLKMDRILEQPLNAYHNQGVWLQLLIERGNHGLAIAPLLLPTARRQKYIFVYISSCLLMHLLAYFINALQPFSAPIVPECHLSHVSVRWGLFQKRHIKWRDSCPNCDWGAGAASARTLVRNYGPLTSHNDSRLQELHTKLIAYCCRWQSLNFFMGWLTARAQRSRCPRFIPGQQAGDIWSGLSPIGGFTNGKMFPEWDELGSDPAAASSPPATAKRSAPLKLIVSLDVAPHLAAVSSHNEQQSAIIQSWLSASHCSSHLFP